MKPPEDGHKYATKENSHLSKLRRVAYEKVIYVIFVIGRACLEILKVLIMKKEGTSKI